MKHLCRIVCAQLLTVGLAWSASGARAQGDQLSLAEMSLEQLSDIVVTSVSGRAQALRSAASSIYVITGDEIRRSGVTSLPEALRLAPNLQVAQLNAGQWAISARGFNNALSNKLLVLVDGRTIYSTLFAGVFWDFHDLMLEDIDRIEVVSGAGGTLWGANAVNGVINIVTKPSDATQGALVSVQRSHSGGQEAARLGLRAGSGHLRLYALARDRDNTWLAATGAERADATSKRQVGFRADWDMDGSRRLTVQGDAFEGGNLPSSNLAPKMSGGNLLARFESRMADGSPYRLQGYWDVYSRNETLTFNNRSSSADLQFVHEPHRLGAHQWIWGAGYRQATDRNTPTPLVAVVPAERSLNWWNLFAQDQIALDPRTELTLGLKAEHNSYTQLEWLPSVRIARRHEGQSTTWAALSRAIRAPSRIDRDFWFPGQAPFVITGGPDFSSEVANVLEVGHRGDLGRNLNYDATVFTQRYRGLRASSNSLPVQVQNRIEGHVDGLEAWANWDVRRNWRLSAGYTRLRQHLHFSGDPPPAALAAAGFASLGNDPRSQWKLRSSLDMGHRTSLDVMVRHVGALPSPTVPAYTAVDARLGWSPRPDLELSLIGQNLFDPRHVEFNGPANASEIPRRVWLRAVWQL